MRGYVPRRPNIRGFGARSKSLPHSLTRPNLTLRGFFVSFRTALEIEAILIPGLALQANPSLQSCAISAIQE